MKKSKAFKVLKWVLGIIACLLIFAVLFFSYVSFNVSNRIDKVYNFKKEALAINADSATLIKGGHLVEIKGCTDCHSKDLGGKVFIDDGGLGKIVSVNITKGKGGLPANYSTEDWVMALRHGVNREGKPLLLMPSHETALLSKEDLAAIIAYCQQVPNVDRELPESKIGPVGKILTFMDKLPLLAVEKIDHNLAAPETADKTVGIGQGAYLAVSCKGCHRDDMRGGDPIAPGFPPVPNITTSGSLKNWTEDQFKATLKTGKTPSGHQMKPEHMPWQMTAQYTDDEIKSVYLYLKSLK